MTIWRQYNILSFPDSINGRVTNNAANPFNDLIPFENFTGFDYDYVLVADNINVSCKQASTSCEQTHEGIRCAVFSPLSSTSSIKRMDIGIPSVAIRVFIATLYNNHSMCNKYQS